MNGNFIVLNDCEYKTGSNINRRFFNLENQLSLCASNYKNNSFLAFYNGCRKYKQPIKMRGDTGPSD